MTRLKIMLLLLALGAQGVYAEEKFNLKFNMLTLNAELGEIRERMIRNDKKGALEGIKRLKVEAHDLLSNKKKIESLLPPAKRHKSYIALESAKVIADNIEVIEDAYGANTRQLNDVQRQVKAQRAYTSIELACFHCHNLVRDQE